MKVVCIGDSITAAQHAPRGSGWVELLGYGNAGVNGDTTRLMLERFPADVQQSGAEVVVIQAGHNDANCWQTDMGLPRVMAAGFRTNLIEMVERARHFGIVPVLVGITRPERDADYVRRCRHYDRIVGDVAAGYGVRHVPMWGVLDASAFMADGLHLSEYGHRRYAELVSAAMPVPA